MGIKFFGHYLLDEGKISKEQLTDAIEYQSEKNLSLGKLAVREKLISDVDAQKINDKQRTLDKRFGEVAIGLNLLEDSQILQLLEIQKKEKIFFGEILVLKKFMTDDEVKIELSRFEEQQHIEVVELDTKIKNIDKDGALNYSISILQKLYSRIVHDHIKLISVNVHDTTRSGIISLQKMRGDVHLDFAIQAEDSVSLAVSSKFMKMEFVEIEEMVYDIMSEFVNVVLGNIAVKLSSEGKKVDLTPPITINQENFNYADYYCFDFVTTQGNLTLCLKL